MDNNGRSRVSCCRWFYLGSSEEHTNVPLESKTDYDFPNTSYNFTNPRKYLFFFSPWWWLQLGWCWDKQNHNDHSHYYYISLFKSLKWLPASFLQTLMSLSSLGYSPGPSGSVSQSVSERVREAGASPAVVRLQCSGLHDVKAYR